MQNRVKIKSQHNKQKSQSSGNSKKKRNTTDRSEVAVTMDQTKKFVKTPDDASESSSN